MQCLHVNKEKRKTGKVNNADALMRSLMQMPELIL